MTAYAAQVGRPAWDGSFGPKAYEARHVINWPAPSGARYRFVLLNGRIVAVNKWADGSWSFLPAPFPDEVAHFMFVVLGKRYAPLE